MQKIVVILAMLVSVPALADTYLKCFSVSGPATMGGTSETVKLVQDLASAEINSIQVRNKKAQFSAPSLSSIVVSVSEKDHSPVLKLNLCLTVTE